MMGQFFITLPSNSSMRDYPDNTTSNYITSLPKKVELPDDYEVALVEASFPFTFVHFPGQSETVTTRYKSGREYIAPIPTRYYATPQDLLFHINPFLPQGYALTVDDNNYCVIGKTQADITLKARPVVPRVRLSDSLNQADVIDELLAVELTPQLMSMLGFTRRNILGLTRSTYRINLFVGLPEQMYYYADLVHDQLVGDTLAPLLRVVNSGVSRSGTYGATHTISFMRPYYIPVMKRNFDTIEILIKDAQGRNVSFSHGTSTCTLHFRRRGYV